MLVGVSIWANAWICASISAASLAQSVQQL